LVLIQSNYLINGPQKYKDYVNSKILQIITKFYNKYIRINFLLLEKESI